MRTLALARRAKARVREIPDRHLRRRGSRLVDAGRAFAEAEALLGLGQRDDEPFESVLRRERAARGLRETAAMARAFVRGFYLADPRTASALALARMTHALDELDGDVMSRVEGGYARVLDPLVRELRRGAAEVRLSTVVVEVRWRPGEVRVHARARTGAPLAPIAGRAAIVTVPVSILRAGGIRFAPPLEDQERAAGALDTGPVVKVLLRFRRAPWRPGLAFLHVPGASVPVFWTLAPIEAPLLVGWAGGPDAGCLVRSREQDVVRAAVAAAARGLGRSRPELEELLDGATVVDWARDPFALGGYAVFPVGSGWASAALARSVERTLFFAGEATAGAFAGTVDGALRTGERAAQEVVDALR